MKGNAAIDVEKLLYAPLEATWVVTSRCNLRCSYCLEDPMRADAPDDASEETRETIVGELVAARVLRVCVSGGEPLLVPSVTQHISRLSDGGVAVRLTTNGTLIDGDTAGRLNEAGLSAVEVSLHAGAEEAVRRAVGLLVERGVRTIVRIVVTPRNRLGLEEIIAPFISSGAAHVALQEVAPLGRAALDAENHLMDAATLAGVRMQVEEMNRRWGKRVNFASTTLAEESVGHPVPCSLGARIRKACEIRPDGNVIPCSPASVYGVRNLVSEKGLRACWRDLPRLYAPFAEAPPGGRCERCLSTGVCGGGCRAVSFMLSGERSGGNPVCSSFRESPRARS